MAKFSLAGEGDGEGTSNRVPKRQRFIGFSSAEEGREVAVRRVATEEAAVNREDEEQKEEDGEEEGSDAEVEEEDDEEDGQETEGEKADDSRDGSISVTLTDPEVLDCSICYDPLTIPVFQCDNGHTACSTCCLKIRNRCPYCLSPIGYIRCRAIERVLESVKVSCRNSKYGCKESFSYSMKNKHDKTCKYMPCACPMSDCSFTGSLEQLCQHFGCKHKDSAVHFHYNYPKTIAMHVETKFVALREEKDGAIFILNNGVERLGNVVSVSRIGPSSMEGCFYDLFAKTDDTSAKLQSFTKSFPRRVDTPSPLGFLFIPDCFSSTSRQLKIDFCIRSYGIPYGFQRPKVG